MAGYTAIFTVSRQCLMLLKMKDVNMKVWSCGTIFPFATVTAQRKVHCWWFNTVTDPGWILSDWHGNTPCSCRLGFITVLGVVQSLSHVRLSATPWTVARQAPLSIALPRQEHWSGLPFPFPGGLTDPGIKPTSPALQADSFYWWAPEEAPSLIHQHLNR